MKKKILMILIFGVTSLSIGAKNDLMSSKEQKTKSSWMVRLFELGREDFRKITAEVHKFYVKIFESIRFLRSKSIERKESHKKIKKSRKELDILKKHLNKIPDSNPKKKDLVKKHKKAEKDVKEAEKSLKDSNRKTSKKLNKLEKHMSKANKKVKDQIDEITQKTNSIKVQLLDLWG